MAGVVSTRALTGNLAGAVSGVSRVPLRGTWASHGTVTERQERYPKKQEVAVARPAQAFAHNWHSVPSHIAIVDAIPLPTRARGVEKKQV